MELNIYTKTILFLLFNCWPLFPIFSNDVPFNTQQFGSIRGKGSKEIQYTLPFLPASLKSCGSPKLNIAGLIINEPKNDLIGIYRPENNEIILTPYSEEKALTYLEEYMNNGYLEMNRVLNGNWNSTNEVYEKIELVRQYLLRKQEQNPDPDEAYQPNYRGIKLQPHQMSYFKQGHTISFDQFVSTSKNPIVPLFFSGFSGTTLEIYGRSGVCVDGKLEQEVLYPPGSHFQVDHVGGWWAPHIRLVEVSKDLSIKSPESHHLFEYREEQDDRDDQEAKNWILKSDDVRMGTFIEEGPTSAEVISAAIYRHFGFQTPDTKIIYQKGKRYSASKILPSEYRAMDSSKNFRDHYPDLLHENQKALAKFCSMKFISLYLMDWDRLAESTNIMINRENPLDYYLIDFGGTLGFRAMGGHKQSPHLNHYDSINRLYNEMPEKIGAFGQENTFEEIWNNFRVDSSLSNHCWSEIRTEKKLLLDIFENFILLGENSLKKIIEAAKYTDDETKNKLLNILLKRRKIFLSYLAKLIQNEGEPLADTIACKKVDNSIWSTVGKVLETFSSL